MDDIVVDNNPFINNRSDQCLKPMCFHHRMHQVVDPHIGLLLLLKQHVVSLLVFSTILITIIHFFK